MAAAAGSTKISWLLREFPVHSTVTCSTLGKTTCRLLATGGDDCRVSVWSLSKANCIMTLTGHKTSVECVQINSSEDQIAAGSQSGSIRVWDLEAAKSVRTLMGHNSNVTSLSFHPFGNLLASSSIDTNIKVWDIRKKKYVLSFKDHTEAVRTLAFSPDGKWLASAGDDCTVKLWDLPQRKIINEFISHSAPVGIIQFHPNEYLLASGSSDRTIKLWDLEQFSLVSSLEGDTSSVRCILFSEDGSCLFSGASDSLRVFGWEPDRCFDVVPVGWGGVSDLSVHGQQLIAVSHQLSTISTYVVDLKKVKSGGSAAPGSIQDDRPLAETKEPRGTTLRRNYVRPDSSSSSQREKRRSDAERRSPEGERRNLSEEETEEKFSTAEIHNADDYNEIFQPRNAISRTPPRVSEPFPAPPDDEAVLPSNRHVKDPVSAFPDKQQTKSSPPPPLAPPSAPVQRVKPTVVSSTSSKPPTAVALPPLQSPPQAPPPSGPRPVELIPSNRNAPLGLNMADFLPASGSSGSLSDEEALTRMNKGHDTMCVMLSSRLKNLETVRAAWHREDVKSAVETAVSMRDLSVVVDLLNIINLQPSLWKLDLCTTVLPQIDTLLQSKYESYMHTGCSSLKLIMKHFWPLISDTMKATPSVGVDITREERHRKCQLCCSQLRNLRPVVKNKAGLVGRHGSTFSELQLLMAPLDDVL